jgi:hypothetical protein
MTQFDDGKSKPMQGWIHSPSTLTAQSNIH